MKKFFLAVCLFLLLTIASGAFAASLDFLPNSSTVISGREFNVAVLVSSPDREVNAVSGSLRFDMDKLSVVSLSKQGSILNLWIKEPNFSNISGKIDFEGIALNPGFKGQSGKIINIVFKAKGLGAADFAFNSGSVLANDGKGSNILAKTGFGNYSIIAPQVNDSGSLVFAATNDLPLAQIISSTHPDSEQWYLDGNPSLSWQNPKSVVAVRLAMDNEPDSLPSVIYTPPISTKEIKNLENGVWYFHLQQKDQNGWGKVANFKINIDKDSPQPFEIKIEGGVSTANPRPELFFNSEDLTSGIDFYEVKIDNEPTIKTRENSFKTNLLKIGSHFVSVRAVDKAGNAAYAANQINIIPIDGPKVLNYRKQLSEGSPLLLKGVSLANVSVNIFVQDQLGNIITDQVKSDQIGSWGYTSFPLEAGMYRVWAKNTDATGASSEESEKITVTVEKPAFIRFGKVAIDYLSVVVTLLALLAVLLCGFLWLIGRLRRKRDKVSTEVTEAQKASFAAFSLLKKEVEQQVAKIDRIPGLNKREKGVADKLKEALDISEKFISKEIKDIKDEIEKK